MASLTALRTHPHFAPLFAYVHVLCWPILWWQINRFYGWTRREGITDALYTVNRWGLLTVVYLGDKTDPAAYRPVARTFRPLTDAGWASGVPANLSDPVTRGALRLDPILLINARALAALRPTGAVFPNSC